MPILSDVDLLRKYSHIITSNRDRGLVNAASIDLRIGHSLLEERTANVWKSIDLTGTTKEQPYILDPQDFVLVATLEEVHIPNGYAGIVRLKSSRARQGYNHCNAGFIDPGWRGVLTMELKNETRLTPLPIYLGLRIAQLTLTTLIRDAKNLYAGLYQNATSVEPCKDL